MSVIHPASYSLLLLIVTDLQIDASSSWWLLNGGECMVELMKDHMLDWFWRWGFQHLICLGIDFLDLPISIFDLFLLLQVILMFIQNGFGYECSNMIPKFKWWIKQFGHQKGKSASWPFVGSQDTKVNTWFRVNLIEILPYLK